MEPLHSPSWYRVAELRPRVNPQAHFHRHEYRGRTAYVVQNPTTGRVHRLTPEGYALVAWLDGERTTDEAWQLVLERLKDEAPSQDETLSMLGTLYAADLLRCDVPADTALLFARVAQERGDERRRRWSPLSLRLPLLDPDAFLVRARPLARLLFSPLGALVWCAVVGCGAVSVLRHVPELAAAAGSLREPAGLLALWFAYPLVKALHELGHGLAVKRFGGDVRELGLQFMVLMPVPYVDASAASVFAERHRRMLVGAAGIGVELFLAALAALLWGTVEAGAVRRIAYAVLMLGGFSTLFVNGNPLLRFDGYYVLADAIGIPNLAARANQYVGVLARRWILGLRERLPETTPREPLWLVGYALGSFAYRLSATCAIALYLAGNFFVIGVALALAAVAGQVLLPLVRHALFVLRDPAVGERRGRALASSLGMASLLLSFALAVPLPLRTRSEGVIWLPERSQVRAGAEGFVSALLVEPDQRVREGEPLVRVRDAASDAKVRVLEAALNEQRVRMQAALQNDVVKSEVLRESVAESEAELAHARENQAEHLLHSPCDGVFVLADSDDWIGRYVRHGQVVAYVIDESAPVARVVVPQEDVALLREHTLAVWVRLAPLPGRALRARVAHEIPAATDQLPTRALGTAGGGPFAVDPSDPNGLRTQGRVFQFELELPPLAEFGAPGGGSLRAIGAHVHVRFDHPAEPLAQRGYRAVRRLFLRQLGV